LPESHSAIAFNITVLVIIDVFEFEKQKGD